MKFRYQKLPFIGYDSSRPLVARPYLPVDLFSRDRRTQSPYFALLDSGADHVLFHSELASEVGIADIRTGKGPFSTVGIAGQKTDVYYHTLDIQVIGDTRRLPTEIGFSDAIFIPILGRSFFVHFKMIIFSEKKEEIELKLY